jgi:hypothetical protein
MAAIDYLRVAYPLPDPEYQDLEFQTKSLPIPGGERLLIDGDGRLRKERFHLEEERPAAPQSPVDPGSWMIYRRVSDGWADVSFYGELIVYTSVDDGAGHDGEGWVQYRARFAAGRLQWLRRGAAYDR